MSDKVIFVTGSVTEVKTQDVEGVGRLRWVGDKCYRWVKYAGSAALTKGALVCHAAGANPLVEVSAPATASLGLLAGVVPTAVPAGNVTAQYFWVQVLGVADVNLLPHTQATNNYAALDYVKAVNAQLYGTVDASTQASYQRTLQVLVVPTTHTTPTANVRQVPAVVKCL